MRIPSVHVGHQDAVGTALKRRPNEPAILRRAETFQVLSNPTRLRIVEALSDGELCVCDLAAVVGGLQSGVSHHLRLLRQSRLVAWRREGRVAYYRLDDDHVDRLLEIGLAHVRER